jgi:SAM-dependent methyltransferase
VKALVNGEAENNDFLNPVRTHRTISSYLPRRAILRALSEHLQQFRGTVLDVGCGKMPYKSILLGPPSRAVKYIGLDLPAGARPSGYNAQLPDLEWDGRTIPLPSNSIESAIATEVFEFCADIEELLREACRVLAPSGILFYTVPFLWPIHDFPHDKYRYTPFSLEDHFINAGFTDVKMRALGGWDLSLAQMIGLWVGRRPMNPTVRRILSGVAAPVMSYLDRRDVPPAIPFDFDGTIMITGIAGTAIKPKFANSG